MKIAIISVRGIPNSYGGFEQFAEYISVGLVKRGHEVVVYSPHYNPYKEEEYNGVRIKRIYSPEGWMGSSVGSFFYDFFSLRDALKKEHFDIIYDAGYTSIVPAYMWFDVAHIKYPIFVTNMDGLEYKRAKYNGPTRKFLNWEEKMAVRHTHYLVADNMGIHDYYKEKYGKESKFMAYGADVHDDFCEEVPAKYGLSQYQYYLLIARMEPENNIEMVVDGYLASQEKEVQEGLAGSGVKPLVVVGVMTTKYGRYLEKKYGNNPSVKFLGGIYDFKTLDSLRYFSYAYFHGHSVGGTNPSLLEAMASRCFILAHDNQFNRAVLKDDALYFANKEEIVQILSDIEALRGSNRDRFVSGELDNIRQNYSWEHLTDQYEEYFLSLLANQPKK